MEVVERLHSRAVLVRLNAFILSYFGWIGFGILYGYLGRWSRDLTPEFLKLPLTSREFVLSLLNFTKSIPPLYVTLKLVYYLGFAGSIAIIVAYLLVYLGDIRTSDELLARYLIAYTVAGGIYLLFHIYSPHYVYQIPGYSMENTLLTRQEFVLPSLHNAFAAINIITAWKYRRRLGGKLLIAVNTLIPFATLLLAHHWIYDIVTGFVLGTAVSELTDGWIARIPEKLYGLEVRSLRLVTMVNLIAALIVFLIAINPVRWIMLVRGILGQP